MTIISVQERYAEEKQDLDSFALFLTYTYNLPVRQTATLPRFTLKSTPLPTGPTVNARSMPLVVGEIDSSFADELRLFRRAAVLSKTADKNSMEVQAQGGTGFNRHVGFEPPRATGKYVIDELYPLMASSADQMA